MKGALMIGRRKQDQLRANHQAGVLARSGFSITMGNCDEFPCSYP